jgi:peptidoglycan L-alanyl-D-glutamate endopeptidase CwlK
MPAGFKFGARSLRELQGVHPDLVAVVNRALELSKVDFAVTDGVRTLAEQQAFFAAGATKTMKSRHLGGFAVDVVACIGPKKISYSEILMKQIKDAMFQAAKELKVPIRWGGDWNCNGDSGDETFVDMPHFELSSRKYPDAPR